jgi:CRISPR/Cas system-associated exonuclease Cas4 (RecB family)
MTAGDEPRITPSDLAEYAYCPRAHWYRHHPPAGGPPRASVRRAEQGESFHAATLRGARRRARHAWAYGAAVAVGLLLLVVGVAWLLF